MLLLINSLFLFLLKLGRASARLFCWAAEEFSRSLPGGRLLAPAASAARI
jgi:hypothetical protein